MLGYVYLTYKSELYYWEFIHIFLRTLVAIIVNLYYEQIILKINLIILLIFISILIHRKVAPFYYHKVNIFYNQASGVQIVNLLVGTIIYTNQYIGEKGVIKINMYPPPPPRFFRLIL